MDEDNYSVNDILQSMEVVGDAVDILENDFNGEVSKKEACTDVFAEHKHQHWKEKTDLSRCDFKHVWKITPRGGVVFISIWKKSIMGKLLTEIKEDDSMVKKFADEVSIAIREVLGENLNDAGWALITAPRRRHIERNFATLICIEMAKILQVPFYEDILHCKSKHRVGAVFTLSDIPNEKNIIVFDDIVTTGSTLGLIKKAFEGLGKNLVFFTGINNKL